MRRVKQGFYSRTAGRIRRVLLLSFTLFCLFSTVGFSQLLLNEMMSFNGTTLSDQFNEYPDWLELYNAGTETEYLGNYWLSDDKYDVKKWQLPAVPLAADDYMVYFASGRNIIVDKSYWHTVVDVGDEWSYYIPVSDIGKEWRSSSAATSTWQTGKSGIGYGDGDDSTLVTMRNEHLTLYMQISFELTDPSRVNNAALHMDYDDGFIAYLNGTEIARSSNMGNYGDEFAFDEPSLAGHEAVMFNGNAPDYFDAANYLNLLHAGENVLAIEVHNVTLGSSDLTAIPFFLLGFDNVQEEFELGNKYIVVHNIFPHTNFRIDSDGEAVYLSDDTGLILDSIATHYVPQDYSLGRILSDPEIFGYFEDPTPGYKNSEDYALEYVADSVLFTISGKEYDPIQYLQLTAPSIEDPIYFSRDGSEPGLSSDLYSGSITIDSVQVIRARIIREGELPGPVSTKTFFTGRKPGIARVSVSTTPKNLWDYYTGIYVLGPNAADKNPNKGANFWMDWEKPANIEVYNANGEEYLNQCAGLKIYGNYSRARPQKSLAFYARSAYGDGSFSYPLFETKDIDKYEAFILRNGGNDFNGSLIRDAVSACLADKLGIDHQAYKPVVLYLNGEYYGIMNMREKINEHFIAGNSQVHPEDVNLLEKLGRTIEGSNTTYTNMMSYLRSNNISQEEHFAVVREMMDLDNYIRYWLLQVYINNRDWPGNNIKFWSTQAPGSKYRWIIYDTDFGYGKSDNPGYHINTIGFAYGLNNDNWANKPEATELMRLLSLNQGFRYSLINQIADRMNTDLLPENIIAVIDSFQNQLIEEAPYHFQKWGNSVSKWNDQLNIMRTFANERPAYMINHVLQHFEISGTHDITLNVSDTEAGYIRINSIIPDTYPFTGTYYNEIPIQLEAIPAPGHTFTGWEGSLVSSSKVIDYDMISGGNFTAVFADASSLPVDVVINEINYASSIDKDTEDWVELYNNSDVSLDLGGWSLIDYSSGNRFTIPNGRIFQARSYMVFSRSLPDFKRFYPELSPVLGELGFGLNGDNDGIALMDNRGEVRDYVIFGSAAPWPEEANGTGATLELKHPDLDNTLPGSWKASLDQTGTPLQKNSQYLMGIMDPGKLSEPDIQLYPTVFSDKTSLGLSISTHEQVSISVISITGRVVEVLENGNLSPGDYQYEWKPGSDIEPGMYFIRLSTNNMARTFKVIYR